MPKGIVVARICGGMGNQLFIYAMAKSIALELDYDLQLDITSGYNVDKFNREYCLHKFNINSTIADKYSSFSDFFGRFRRRIDMFLSNYLGLGKFYHLIEKNTKYQPIVFGLNPPKNIYIQGFWQSEKYFKTIEGIIRSEFVIKSSHCIEAIQFLSKIQSTNSVAIHLRSYLEVSKDVVIEKVGLDYYLKASKLIASKVSNPHFYIFSDNLQWAINNLQIDFPYTIVDLSNINSTDKAIEDFWLMSKCKHQIIANSTFSWWAAWLNSFKNKIVITPNLEWNNKDIIPNEWFKIDF
jgi:hypothetical protein